MLQASLLDDVATVIGYTPTCALAAWYGGKNLYVPGAAGDDHPLVAIIGGPALRALVREFASETLRIPRDAQSTQFRRDRSVAERYAEGWTPARVADEADISLRRAEQLRVELTARGWVAYAAGRLERKPAP